ncbi:MAG: hypothetical protein GX767_04355 [Firmicutes bacterium]|nr:hypothetical protein [Bacillota bacterium]
MNRPETVFLAAALLFILPAAAAANAGPTYWPGHPSATIMSVDAHSPISVEREDLIFDFSEQIDSDYTLGGRVTASYEMLNPTNRPQQVQMAFPFVGRLGDLPSVEIEITADGKTVPYEIYPGDVVNNYGHPGVKAKEAGFAFANIVNTITEDLYEAQNFAADEKGKLYTLKVRPTGAERINFAVDFAFDSAQTKILSSGFDRYERNESETRIAAWCYEPKTLELLVLGNDIALNTSAYADGELGEKTNLYSCQILSEEVAFKPYFMNYIKNHTSAASGMISDSQLYNLYAKSLDKSFTQNMGFSCEHDLTGQEHYRRIITLVYQVDFPAHSQKEVSVSYHTLGTMDMTKTASPLYTFDYILNPAQNWSSFNNLHIEIITPARAPYIVDSNIDFAKKPGSNTYTATLADLPQADLFFTLYSKEKITLLDRLQGKFIRNLGYLAPLLLGTAAILIISVLFASRLVSWTKKSL